MISSIRERLADWIDLVLYLPTRVGNTRAYYIMHTYPHLTELMRYLDKLCKNPRNRRYES